MLMASDCGIGLERAEDEWGDKDVRAWIRRSFRPWNVGAPNHSPTGYAGISTVFQTWK